jgi:hypothetical protein
MLYCTAAYLGIDAAKMCASGISAVKASFEISAVSKDLDGEARARFVATHSFTGSVDTWGWRQFIPLDQLRQADSHHMSNDRLLLCVNKLTVLNTVAAPPAVAAPPVVAAPPTIAHSGCMLM